MTFLDLIEKQEKNKNIPGPGAYEAKIKNKVLGALHLMEEKTSFIDEAQFRGKSTPSHQYNIKYNQILGRTVITKIHPPKNKPGEKIKF